MSRVPDSGQVVENSADESMIVADQDQTDILNSKASDRNMGSARKVAQGLQDEPAEFVRGEVDVKTQMDRTMRSMDRALAGSQRNDEGPDSPETDLEIADRPNKTRSTH